MIWLVAFLWEGKASAQQDTILWQHLVTTESATVEAVALYPTGIRSAILHVSQHPEVLARIDALQQSSSAQFRQLIGNLTQDEQSRIYNVGRYPDLLQQWLASTDKGAVALSSLLSQYPESVQADFRWLATWHPDILPDIHQLYEASSQQTTLLLAGESADTRRAFLQVLELPEVMSLLTSHLSATVLLGDIYRRDSVGTMARLDSLQQVLALRKTEELTQWQQELAADSAALAELEAAAQSYAEEQHLTTDIENQEEATTQVDVYLLWRPYSYWFGWPYWYTYAYWYPYPWYHWGYYYLPGETIVFIGLPSYDFLYWCLYDFDHFYYYPHLTHRYLYYTERHPEATNTVTATVAVWRSQLQEEVPPSWLADDGNRVDRIRQYGAFVRDYQAAVGTQVDGVPAKEAYLSEHIQRYPALREVLSYRQRVAEVAPQQPVPVPKVDIPVREPSIRVVQPESYEPDRWVAPRQPLDRAIRYHDFRWNQTPQPVLSPTPIRQPVAPTPRVRPSAPILQPRREPDKRR